LSTEIKDGILRAKQTGKVCLVLRRAGIAFSVLTITYNTQTGGVAYAAERLAKDVTYYDELDPLMRYAAHSASTAVLHTLIPGGFEEGVKRHCLKRGLTPELLYGAPPTR